MTTHKTCNYVQFVANQTDKVPNVNDQETVFLQLGWFLIEPSDA